MGVTDDKSNSVGAKAAFGRRMRGRAKARLWAYRGLRVAGTRPVKAFPDYFEFWPEVSNAREFSDLSARASCYLRDAGIPLYLPGSRFACDQSLVPDMDAALVRDPGWIQDRPAGVGHVVIHRVTPKGLSMAMMGKRPFTVVDHRLHANSELQYFVMRNECSWPTYRPAEEALERLRALTKKGGSAFILATGPSALEIDTAAVDADIRITCNSAVRNLELIQSFRPSIIAFMDPVFHFGPSRYAAEFRKRAIWAAEEVDALVVCGDRFAGPLLSLAPALRARLVVIPQQTGGTWRWPTDRNPTVKHGGNVLTGLMLPLALMLADHVTIAGADGRQPTENYYWKHNPALQFSDELMESVFNVHPAFFRDRDYEDYYDDHCRNLEELIQVGESHGKTVHAATPSWIPALRVRTAEGLTLD